MDVLSENAHKIIVEELDALKQRIIANHRSAGQVASGRTIASLHVTGTEDGGILYGRQAFGALETGRRPGRTPCRFSEVIKQWILDKGIRIEPIPYVRQPSERWQPKYTSKERGLIALSNAIAYKIKAEGTKLYRDGGRSDIYSQEIPSTTSNIEKRLLGIFETEVKHINLNNNADT